MTGYELGHRASISGDKMEVAFPEVVAAVDVASYYHLIFSMFYHPVFIFDESGARKAIEGFLSYIKDKELPVLHLGTNAVAEWWNARAESGISDVTYDKDILSFNAHCSYKEGMIIKVPVEGGNSKPTIDGRAGSSEEKYEFGITWIYLICPQGNHEIQILASGGPAG